MTNEPRDRICRSTNGRVASESKWALCFCLLCLLADANAQEAYQTNEAAGDVIVLVGDDPIRRADIDLLLHRRGWTATQRDASPALRSALAETLVRRQLALQTLKRSGSKSAELKVQQAIKLWEQQVAATGQTLSQYADKHATDVQAMQTEIAWLTLWNDYLGARLTDENLEKFFNTRPFLFDDTQVDVSQIFLKDVSRREFLTQLAEQIRDESISFESAAKEFSDAGSAAEGGHLGWIDAEGDLPDIVAAACLSSEADTLLPVIRSSLGLHLIFVHEVRPGHRSFSELNDHRRLRRQAADFLFEHLIRQSGDTTVRWIDVRYKPVDKDEYASGGQK
ncbi:MAG: peptidylprolyl isomerase [Pirellulaceae bacterium]